MAEQIFTSNVTTILKRMVEVDESVLFEIGELVTGHAKELCPVGQYPARSGRVGGRLKDSIDYVVIPEDKRVDIGTPVEYSGFVEKGTSKMSAQPYLTPAAENNGGAIQQIVENGYRGIGQ